MNANDALKLNHRACRVLSDPRLCPKPLINAQIDDSIRFRAKEFEANGLKAMDALHVACAEAAECDWFFTTDRGILKKARNLISMRVANPVEFFGGD